MASPFGLVLDLAVDDRLHKTNAGKPEKSDHRAATPVDEGRLFGPELAAVQIANGKNDPASRINLPKAIGARSNWGQRQPAGVA
jgi:hypothetical protein